MSFPALMGLILAAFNTLCLGYAIYITVKIARRERRERLEREGWGAAEWERFHAMSASGDAITLVDRIQGGA